MYTLHDMEKKGRRVGRTHHTSLGAGYAARALDRKAIEAGGDDALAYLQLRKRGVPVDMTGGGVEMYYFVKGRES